MVRRKEEKAMQTQVVPPRESPQVKAFDEKLIPLKQRRDALEMKMSECLSLVNPYTVSPAPDQRTLVEARLSLPQAQADLQRIGLDIADLEGARANALDAEQARAEEEINQQIAQELAQLRRDFEQYIRPTNRKIHELEELKEKLKGRLVTERFAWWDLLDETATNETRWGIWTRSIAETFGV